MKYHLFYLENSLCEDEGCSYDGFVGCGESYLHVWLKNKIYIKNSSLIFIFIQFLNNVQKNFNHACLKCWHFYLYSCKNLSEQEGFLRCLIAQFRNLPLKEIWRYLTKLQAGKRYKQCPLLTFQLEFYFMCHLPSLPYTVDCEYKCLVVRYSLPKLINIQKG